MSFESNTGLNVANQYGPRTAGGTVGEKTTKDNQRVYTLDLDVDASTGRTPADVEVQAGTIVLECFFHGSAGDAAILVGTDDVTAATYAVPVVSTDGGALTFTNSTGTGKVTITTITPEA